MEAAAGRPADNRANREPVRTRAVAIPAVARESPARTGLVVEVRLALGTQEAAADTSRTVQQERADTRKEPVVPETALLQAHPPPVPEIPAARPREPADMLGASLLP